MIYAAAVSYGVMRILSFLMCLLALPLSAYSQSSGAGDSQPTLERERALLQQGKTDDALSMLKQLADSQPPVKGVQHDFGVIYYRTGKLADAQKAFAAAIQEDGADAESVQMEGLTLYRMGQPANAILYLERVRQWMPNANADSNYVLGLCLVNSRRYDEARAAFAQEFGVPPASASAYLLLSSMLMRADLPELAAEQAAQALKLDPNLPLVHFTLGEVYLFKSDLEHATSEFEEERRINPNYAPTYDRLGDVYTRADKLQDAQEALTKALSLDLSSTGPFIQMGKVLLHRGDPTTATMYLRHAEKMDPGNFVTHTLLAEAYRKSGQPDEAKRETEIASKIHVDGQLKLQPVQ